MRYLSTAGLRVRLSLFTLLIFVPTFGFIVYTVIHQRERAVETAENDMTNLVRSTGREQGRIVADTRQLLARLSQLPEVKQTGTAATCNLVLAGWRNIYPHYLDIGVATPRGDVFCSTQPPSHPVNIADRSYFRRTVQSGDFGIGDYEVERVAGNNIVGFGYPVFGAQENLLAVVYVTLDLGMLSRMLAINELPAASVLTTIDANGTILAYYPESERWIGKSMRDSRLGNAILAHEHGEIIEAEGPDGVARLYAFAPLHQDAAGNMFVSVGRAKDVAFAVRDQEFTRNLTLVFFVALWFLGMAWFGSEIFVLRCIKNLVYAARRLSQGDLSAHAELPHDVEELGELARTFDNMAKRLQFMTTSLQRVNRALKTLSAGNRAMVRAGNEQVLLEDICRIIVQVGGYRFAWIGYAEQDEDKTVRPVAQAGFEGGLEALANALGTFTWADTEQGRDLAGTTIRTATPYIAQNVLVDPNLLPWRKHAIQFGYASAAAFPLSVNGKAIGALSIYSNEPDAFDAEELELLTEAAQDLAFGVATLRAREEYEQALKRLAYFDSLTGLPNHAHFEQSLRQSLLEAGRAGQSLALLMIDLTRLREINDALGFQQGDELLREVSLRICHVLKHEDLVARMRGDGFAVLLSARDSAHAADVALQILDSLGRPFAINGLRLDINATVGISLFPQHGAEATHLIRHADVAMHQAKKSGKAYVIYNAEQDEDSPRRLAMAGELRSAIEKNEFVLHYQPKIDTSDDRVCGVEALVRWEHPQQGMIPPDEFISLAEQTGLIKPLTEWVMETALRQSIAWRKAGLVVPIAVNLSARNLRDAELVDKLEQMLSASGAEGNWLELEITEGAVMEDPESALVILKRLSDIGISLFIDDFGTGYSSLSYLKKLPVDAVKIDKSFVIDMLMNADSAAIVRSTIGLAHDLGLKVVAEGVESRAVWDRLIDLDCDVVQGYHISRPLSAEQLIEFVLTWQRGRLGSS